MKTPCSKCRQKLVLTQCQYWVRRPSDHFFFIVITDSALCLLLADLQLTMRQNINIRY